MAISKSKQQEYKKLYQRERERIRRTERSLGKKGIVIERTNIPRYNKNIRLKDVRQLQKITKQSLQSQFTERYFSYATGEYRVYDKFTGRLVDIIPITKKAKQFTKVYPIKEQIAKYNEVAEKYKYEPIYQ